jgi:hypothetical protein
MPHSSRLGDGSRRATYEQIALDDVIIDVPLVGPAPRSAELKQISTKLDRDEGALRHLPAAQRQVAAEARLRRIGLQKWVLNAPPE